MGRHRDALRRGRRARGLAGVRRRRRPTPPMRELLGLFQLLLRARAVGVDLLPLWDPQRADLSIHRTVLAATVVCGDVLVVHRSRAAQ